MYTIGPGSILSWSHPLTSVVCTTAGKFLKRKHFVFKPIVSGSPKNKKYNITETAARRVACEGFCAYKCIIHYLFFSNFYLKIILYRSIDRWYPRIFLRKHTIFVICHWEENNNVYNYCNIYNMIIYNVHYTMWGMWNVFFADFLLFVCLIVCLL